MDFLGLRTLTVIQECSKLIQKDAGVTLDMQKINYDDKKVLDSLAPVVLMVYFSLKVRE